jgi:hypothetical protein
MSSLFFSQDPVAIDSVMYDFLHTEGTGPSEGAQNYLHQSADPPNGLYDPEHDGIYLSHSLGVHEHGDGSFDIFSSNRYSGSVGEGIEYIALGEEYAQPGITIQHPKEKHLYLFGSEQRYLTYLPRTLIVGSIEVEATVNGVDDDNLEYVEFYLDGRLMDIDVEEPYQWSWKRPSFFRHTLQVKAYYQDKTMISDDVVVWKFF